MNSHAERIKFIKARLKNINALHTEQMLKHLEVLVGEDDRLHQRGLPACIRLVNVHLGKLQQAIQFIQATLAHGGAHQCLGLFR